MTIDHTFFFSPRRTFTISLCLYDEKKKKIIIIEIQLKKVCVVVAFD